ncbi:MAG: PD-(D/E)XK nuclease family protein [Niabella sp.]
MEPFLKEVAADLVGKFGLGIQHCAIVFNNKRPSVYLQKYFADIIGKPFFSPSIFTIQDFFDEAVSEKIADFYLQFFTLHKIYNDLLTAEGLPVLKSSQFYPLAKIILSDFNQIDNDLVDADKLYKELEDISTINLEFDFLSREQYEFLSQFWVSYSEGKHKKQQEHFILMWRRMPRLYHSFHARLAEKNCITHGAAYRKLAGSDIAQMRFLNRFSKIIFVGFNALTQAEATLFTKLQKAGKALFYFDADTYYLNDPLQEAGLFLRKNISGLKLKNEFATPGNFMQTLPHKVDVYKVQGQSAQAKILNQLTEKEYSEDSAVGTTAIILADEALLLPALQTIPAKVKDKEVALNVTMGFPFATSAVFGLADLWLNSQQEIFSNTRPEKKGLQSAYISYQHLESFLTHPLINLPQAGKDKIRSAVLKENVVHIEHNRLIRQGGLLAKFFAEVSQPTQLISALSGILNYVLNDLSAKKILKDIDAQLFVKVIQELNRLNDHIGNYLEGEAFHFVISLIQKVLQGINVPLGGDPLNGVQLMGLLETRNLNFDNLIFLGFNEGVIPKTSIGNSFIPDSLRRVYGLPVLENLDAVSAYIVYRLMQRARNIGIVYNSLTDEHTSGEPSRFLKQIEYESNFHFTYHDLELNVKSENRQQIIIDKRHPLIKERMQQFLDKDKTLSPTAITTYIANPVDFFFAYIADIKEPKEVTPIVEANEVGSILHHAMETFYSSMKNKLVTREWITLSRSSNEALIKKSFGKIMGLKDTDTYEFTGMQLVVLAIVKAYMDIILDEDECYAPFTITGLEEKIKVAIPFELNGSQQSILLKGIIDRVDEKNGVTRIVDYKTGSDKLAFTDNIEKLFSTDDKHINKALIQTMIYTSAYEKLEGKTGVQPILYVVRTMNKEGIHFKNKNGALEQENLTALKPVFMETLRGKLAELFDENIPFRSSEVPDNYKYSIYKTLFGG